MPHQNRHIILRQVLELEVPAGEDGFAFQQELSRIVREKLLPALEPLFDRLAPAGEVVQVDELKIDLGNLPLHNLEEALVKGVLEEMERQLFYPTMPSIYQMQRQPVAGSRFEQWLFFLEKGWLPWQASGVGEAELHLAALEKMASDSKAVEQFIRLLRQHPTVLDRLAMQHPESFLAHLLETLTARNQSKLPALRQELEALLPRVLQAVVGKKQPVFSESTFSQTFWKTLLRLTTEQQMPTRTTEVLAIHFLQEWFAGHGSRKQKSGTQFWVEFFKTMHRRAKDFPILHQFSTLSAWQTFEKTVTASPPEEKSEGSQLTESEQLALAESTLVEKQLEQNQPRFPEPEIANSASEKKQTAQNQLPLASDAASEKEQVAQNQLPLTSDAASEKEQVAQNQLPLAFDDASEKKQVEQNQLLEKQETHAGQTKSPAEESLPNLSPASNLAKPSHEPDAVFALLSGDSESLKPSFQKAEPSTRFTAQEGDAWYVRNAGVVLLHPFFAPFFKEFHLLENDQFLDEAARCRAVHLLQFLATGETGLPEYESLLPKFLCGMPFDAPLERDVPLTEAEKTEGENLLKAAIRHWNKLGNASPAGLREGFLQRDGKLELRQAGWFLCVEQKGTDILLDWLPWNLSIVRLPWLPDLLRVEWA